MKSNVLTRHWPTLVAQTLVFGWLGCVIGSSVAVADDRAAFQLTNHDAVMHEFARWQRLPASPHSSLLLRHVAGLAEHLHFGRPKFLPDSVVFETETKSNISNPQRVSVFADCYMLSSLFDRSPAARIWPVNSANDDCCPNPGPHETLADGEAFDAACETRPFAFRRDISRFGWLVRDDAKHAVNWNNALILAAAGGAVIGIHQDLDGRVRTLTARHPNRWGGTSKMLGKFGDVTIQLPIMLGFYGYSLRQQDEHLHSLNATLFSAYTLTGLSTLLVKAIVNSDRPSDRWNGGQFGFPSYHTASSFTIAAVLEEYYGSNVGVPAYLLAGVIGWSRLDERDHDLSDIVFGAALGFVIGKSVAGWHLRNDSRVRVTPFVRAFDRAAGLAFEIPY